MMIMVHDNTRLPLMERVALQLTPGRKYKLGNYKRLDSFLPSPYTKCSDKVTSGMKAMCDQFSSAHYTYEQKICFIVLLFKPVRICFQHDHHLFHLVEFSS